MALNELPDIEVNLRFGRTYTFLGLFVKLALAFSGFLKVSDHIAGPHFVTEFVNFQLSPLILGLHIIGVLLSIYLSKRLTGRCHHQRILI